jgi:aldehyde:ferredoxin oxidoreductase
MKGMFNKILTVDLTKGISEENTIADQILENYLGGRGLGIKIFTDNVAADTNPLSPQNQLVMTVGPETGTKIPTSGRFALVTKSPLTNTIFFSNTGGEFAVYIKKCGLDGIIITGASEKPVYVVIEEGKETIFKDASSLWGLDTEETDKKIRELEGQKCQVLLIGPAGENLVLIASIMNNAQRAFGRGGVGAVMGSKKLKGIVIKRGTSNAEIHHPEMLNKFVKSAYDKIKVSPVTGSAFPLFGTSALVNIINDLGMFPIENYKKGFSEEAKKVSGEAIRNQLLQKKEGCIMCPMNCGRMTQAGDMKGLGPEYESVWALGPDCGIFDLIKIAQANYYCNLLGIDTISAGSTIACAMELQEKGILKDHEIKFGNADILIPLLKKIAAKEGIGAELSEGSKRFSNKYNSESSSMQVKGLELVAYDPRGAMGHALGYATSNNGGSHLTGYMAAMEIFAAPKKIDRFTLGGKPDLLVLKQHQNAIEDSLVVCKFAGFAIGFDFHSRFVTHITGEDFNISRLLEIGERIYNLERMFNVKAGFSRKDDSLPQRFLDTPLTKGLSKDHVVPLDTMLEGYYAVRKWDQNGIPTEKILTKLGLKPL